MDESRHDANLAQPRADNPRTIRTYQTGFLFLNIGIISHHFNDRDSFGNTADKFYPCINGFTYRLRRKFCRNINNGAIGPG